MIKLVFLKKVKIKFDLPVNCNDNLTLEKEEIILGCCSCKYLNENKKMEGRVNGSLYYCSKLKTYVNGASGSCDNYCIDHGRKYIHEMKYMMMEKNIIMIQHQ